MSTMDDAAFTIRDDATTLTPRRIPSPRSVSTSEKRVIYALHVRE